MRFMPGVIFQGEILGTHARCTFISESARDVLGLAPETIMDDYAALRRLVHAEDRNELQAAVVRAIASVQRLDHEFRIVRPDGAQRWLQASCMPRRVPAGSTVFEGHISDITEHKTTEQALSDARSELRQLGRTMPGAIYQIAFGAELKPRFVCMSFTWADIFRFDPAVAQQDINAFFSTLDQDDRTRNLPLVQRAVQNFEPYEIEFRIKTTQGIAWVRTAARPVRRENGEKIYSAVAVDITELKRASSALEASQRQLSELTATIPGAVFQVLIRPDGSADLTYLSDGVQDIYQVTAAELMGPVEKALAFVPDRDPVQLRERLVSMAQQGEPLAIERPIVSATGERRWLRFVARPVAGDAGVIRYNGVLTDVTASKEAETRLAESEQRLEMALENGQLGLFDWYLDSGHVIYNRQFAKIFGTSPEALGIDIKRLAEFEVPDDLNRNRRAQADHFNGHTPDYQCEYRIRRADGEERWVHGRGRVVERGADGTPTRYIGTISDITNRVSAERRLERQVLFSRLIAQLSSELVNLGASGVDRAIGEALALIGDFTGVDLAYLNETHPTEGLRGTALWSSDHEVPAATFDWSDVPWLRQRLLDRQLVNWSDLASIPADAPGDRNALRAAGVLGLLAIPLYIGDEAIGALVLQSSTRLRVWSPGDLTLLRIVAEIISQALDRKHSERALAAAETTVREVTRALPGIVYQLYRDTTGSLYWRFVSGTLIDQLTSNRTDSAAASLLDLIDPRDVAVLEAALSRSAAARSHLEQDVRLGNGMRWTRISAYPRQLPDGGTLFNGIAIDITDTKLAEAALQASEERFRELYNSTPVMMHSADGNGRIVSVNEHWLTTLGYRREEVVGRRGEEFITAASRARIASQFGTLRADGGLRELLIEMVATSGRRIEVILSANAQFNGAGGLAGVKYSMVDVTERNRALRALEDSELRYRAVVQDQAELICRFSARGRIDFVNDACLRFLQLSAQQAREANWFDVMNLVDAESFSGGLAQLGPETPVGQWELRHVSPTGEDVWCQWTVRAFFDRHGELSGFQAVGRNVTNVKRLERQIREISQREQERIGHDLHDGLGQELTGLSLLLKSLEREVQSEAPHLLPTVRGLAETLNQSIATTRALAEGLSPVQLDHGGLVGALQHMVERSSKLYGVTIHLQAPRNLVLADNAMATDLYRIVQEAVTNAARHADARQIIVAVQEVRGSLAMEVTDDGIGIDLEASRITGMGLKIMRYRANIIGAALEISARNPSGTRVRCVLRQSTMPDQLQTA
jgi:PAS domain S-box-containing protein